MQASLECPQEKTEVRRPEGVLRSVMRNNTLSLVDQAVVSGTNFLTTVLIGRACGKDDLGVFSLAFSIWITLMCFQQALVSVPYIVFGRRLEDEPRRRLAGSTLVHFVGVALVAVVALLVAAVAVNPAEKTFGVVLLVLAAAIPFILMREFRRRFAFAHLNIAEALLIDAGVMVLQLGGLLILAFFGLLNPTSAIAVIGAACALVGGIMLGAARRQFIVDRGEVANDLKRHWKFGRWIVGGELVSVVHGFVVYWLLAIVLGATATGVFAACMTVVMLSNPFTLGVVNSFGPRVSKAFAEGGRAAVMREVRLAGGFVGAVLLAFCIIVFFCGDFLLRTVYGVGFAGQSYTLAALSISVFVGGLAMVAEQALRALERTNIGFISSITGFAVTVGVSLSLMESMGVFGAACGYALGCTVSALIRWTVLLAATRSQEAAL